MAKRRPKTAPEDPQDRPEPKPADKPRSTPGPGPSSDPGTTPEPEIRYYPLNVAPAQSWLLTGQKIAAFDTVQLGEYTIECAERPFVRSLRQLYRLRNEQMPADLAALPGEIYLVTHNVGVVAKRHPKRIKTLGLMASFTEPGTTIDLVPDTRFREYLAVRSTAEGKAEVRLEGELGASGRVEASKLLTEYRADAELGFGAKIQLGGGIEVIGRIAMSVKSPKIQAIGRASSMVIWQIEQDESPLVGDQVLIQTILAPKETRQLTFQLQAFIVIDPGWFSSDLRLEMQPVRAVVNLPDVP